MTHVRMSHGTRTDESCHTYERVTSRARHSKESGAALLLPTYNILDESWSFYGVVRYVALGCSVEGGVVCYGAQSGSVLTATRLVVVSAFTEVCYSAL